MRRLFALYTNEMIKISKKVSVIAILAIMVVIIFGFGGLVKFQEFSNANNSKNYSNSNNQFQKEDMKRQQEDIKIKITEVQEQKGAASDVELQNLEAEERDYLNQLDMLQYAIDKDILINSNSFRAQATISLFKYKETVSQLSSIPAANLDKNQKQQIAEAQKNISTLESIIVNKDFKGYISFLNNDINRNTNMSAEEKKIYLESNEIRLKNNLTGEADGKADIGNANHLIYQIEQGKLSLLKDIDYTGQAQIKKPLTIEQRKKIENEIAIAEYKFEKGIFSNNSNENGLNMSTEVLPIMLKIGIFMLVILVMILAGGSVSSEISTGSIKSLIISPTKRWKIFTAKYLSLMTIGIIGALIAYLFSIIANGIYFGFDAGTSYIYATNGIAHELNYYIYQLARLFTDFIIVVVYMTFAFMLSIITRNTAASVAITIGVYFVGGTANSILMRFTNGDWRKFIPFNNLEFTSKIFSSDALGQTSNIIPNSVNNSLTFSLVYTAILVVCMGYVGLDSLNRRDIK